VDSNGSSRAASSQVTGRPVIGVSTYVERARYGVWDTEAALLPRLYVDCVREAGALPVLLPSIGDHSPELLDRVDGVVLAGGADIEPARYGAQPHPKTRNTRPERDGFEFWLLDETLRRRMPLLAVCRGMQVLNVALGGTLCQHVSGAEDHGEHQPEPGVFGPVSVKLRPGSRAAGLLGEQATGRCSHHQSIETLGEGLESSGWAQDGVVEAMELPGEDFVLGVQWHPEQDSGDVRLFAGLAQAAVAYRKGAV
jgi:putative glutamine amidotransferase